jgi:Ca-activated chloride channel homolog
MLKQKPTNRRRTPMLLSVVFCLAFALFVTKFQAQSGRNQQGNTPQPKSSPATTRSRRAAKRASRTSDVSSEPQESTPTPASASNPSEEVEAGDIIRVNSNLVTVPASVFDGVGKPVTDLSLKDFELSIDGQVKPISEVERSETPVRIALLFDNSESVTAEREMEKEAAVRFFKDVIRPIDQAAIYSVSTTSTLEQPLTNSVRTLMQTIESFGKPDGATALFDGMAQAAADLRPHQGRKVMVIVSDGVDTVSDRDFETTMKEVLVADCQIYVVQTGYTDNPTIRDLTAEQRMQIFAAQTGGTVYIPSTISDLDQAFGQIAADLAKQYVLTYYALNDVNDGRFHAISLRVMTRPNMRVRARKGYYAPKLGINAPNARTPTRELLVRVPTHRQ